MKQGLCRADTDQTEIQLKNLQSRSQLLNFIIIHQTVHIYSFAVTLCTF